MRLHSAPPAETPHRAVSPFIRRIMTSVAHAEEMIIGITPFHEPDARLAAAVSRAGGLGVLDLGNGDRRSREALARVRRWSPGPFGVRVGPHCRTGPSDLTT